MALTNCVECGKPISTLAQACPACGAPPSNSETPPPQLARARDQPKKSKQALKFFGAAMLVLVVLAAVIAMSPQATAPATRSSNSAGAECTPFGMIDLDVKLLSREERAEVCTSMESRLGHPPSLAVVRSLAMTVSAYRLLGDVDSVKELAYQNMNIVEAREQLGDETAMAQTFDVVFKIYEQTQGHLAPKDINILLRSGTLMAAYAKKSDDNLIFMSMAVWQAIKSNGK